MTSRPPHPDWRDEDVRVLEYEPSWPDAFRTEASLVEAAIGPWITGGIHHIGSTAVPNLAAKPVIDILVGVADLASSRPCIDRLAPLEYHYAPYRPEVMHWFCKPDPSRRTHHLHLVPTGSRRYLEELAFRDYLRDHADTAKAYGELKRRLATEFRTDREAYTQGKTDFLQTVLDRASTG